MKENDMARLKGKVAVVTGASKGIGAAIAKTLAAEGAQVVVNYGSSRKEAEALTSKINAAGGKAIAVQANVAKREDVKRLFAETKAAYGKVDILVNNAGVYDFRPLDQIDEEHFRKHFDLNVLGLLFSTQEAVALMPESGGSVINLSSVVAKSPIAGSTVYSATKGAVDTITSALAQELGPRKIRVNAVSPGPVDTEGFRTMTNGDDSFANHAITQTPLGRIGTPDDVAKAVLFFASEDSAWVTGEAVLTSGGIRV